MPKFAANIGDNWLYSHIPFLDRIGAAAKDGFEAVECGNTHYNFDPNEIKKQLDKYNMKWVLLNTDSMPKYCVCLFVLSASMQYFENEYVEPQRWEKVSWNL